MLCPQTADAAHEICLWSTTISAWQNKHLNKWWYNLNIDAHFLGLCTCNALFITKINQPEKTCVFSVLTGMPTYHVNDAGHTNNLQQAVINARFLKAVITLGPPKIGSGPPAVQRAHHSDLLPVTEQVFMHFTALKHFWQFNTVLLFVQYWLSLLRSLTHCFSALTAQY